LEAFICLACGTQAEPSELPPARCPICEDERQYVPAHGQRWTLLRDLRRHNHNVIEKLADGLYSVCTKPQFAIGQRAYLVQTSEGNLLWDCVALCDPDTVSTLWAHGGVAAIAISHPHYYTTMVEWSDAFGGIPVYLHSADRQWVQRNGAAIEFWDGFSKPVLKDLTLVHCGGHFAGGTVLHWKRGGALLTGDVLQVCPDRKHYGFMYSYPNYIPLGPAAIHNIARSLEPYEFDNAYGAFGNSILGGAKEAVRISAERHLRAILPSANSRAC
jgi:hypothetical protein